MLGETMSQRQRGLTDWRITTAYVDVMLRCRSSPNWQSALLCRGRSLLIEHLSIHRCWLDSAGSIGKRD
jgi:hypothetical protein